jgi:hypothetical protein
MTIKAAIKGWIAEKSDIGKLRTEFSKITTFTKIKVSFPVAHL